MATTTVQVLVDDLDGSEAVDTVRIGWDGEWRELDLSKRNLAALSRVLDKYWNAARPTTRQRRARGNQAPKSTSRRSGNTRDPKAIRAWANANGIRIPAKGRIPTEIERQYNESRSRR